MAYTNIDDPSAYFQATLYTGNSSNLTVTNDGNSDLKPDLVWTKCRSGASHHTNVDSSRGASKQIYPNLAYQEETNSGVSGFLTDGFTVGNNGTANSNGATYVAWQWKANGGTTASNTDGSLTSTVQANQDAGFSIVLYTGTGSAATVGHGLGVVPSVMIIRNREYAASWVVYHKDIHADAEEYGLRLNNTNARESNSGFWNNTAPTSSVFTIGGNAGVNNGDNTDTLVAYCFAEKQGYSKFGKYVGNGNADGPFVYTGFKPAFVILKGSSASGSWYMLDSKRDVDNVAHHAVEAQSTAAEYTNYNFIDMLSNGFKLRLGTSEVNTDGNSYIYMAFAENPFTTSTGIPTTAR